MHFHPSIASFACLLVLASASARSFRANDFGALPGTNDAGPGLRKALAAALSFEGPSEVILDPGIYSVGSEKEASYALDVKGASDIGLRGVPGKTVLLMKNPLRGALRFQECDKVSVQGVTVDYDPPPYCQGTIVEVNLPEDTFDLKPEPGFLFPDHPAFEQAKARWGLVVRGDEEGRPVRFGPVAIPAVAESSPRKGLWRMKVGGQSTGYQDPLKGSGMKPGDKIIHLARTYDAAFFLHRCGRVSLQEVTIHASPGAAFCPLLCGRVEIVNCHVRLDPSSNRWLSTDADGIHCRGVREGILVQGCSFEGMADDAINIHSSPIPVLEAVSPTEFVVQKLHYTLKKGDLVQVMDSEACRSRGQAVALEVEELPDQWAYRLTLDKPVAGVRSGQSFAVSDNLYNLSEAGTGSVVRDCHFKSFRGRGILLSCHGCLVEQNTFEVREGWGVVLFHESTRWAEGPLARDIEIRDNVFQGRGGSQPAILAMAVKRDGQISRSREMRNLSIIGNQFLDLGTPAIRLHACSEVLIRDNLLMNAASMTQSLSREDSLLLKDYEAVKKDKAWRIPVTGEERQECAPLDELMLDFLKEQDVPGASLAVAKEGRLVYARGFGYADIEKATPVEPTSLFRIASVSKPITALTVMRLVERGIFSLDEPFLPRLKMKPFLQQDEKIDPRLRKVTVRHLLTHTAGWDREKSYDPMFRAFEIAEEMGLRGPADARQICQYMLGQPLDFDPGTDHVYSNLGYSLLGRLLEDVTGENYEEVVRKEIFTPLGITKMRLGRTLPEDRAPGEVRYYDRKGRQKKARFGPHQGELLPLPYASGVIEVFDAHGGWLASSVELVRIASALETPEKAPLLEKESIEAMFSRPEGPAGYDEKGEPKAAYYGLGWLVRPKPGKGHGRNTWHNGAIAGTSALLVRRWDGLSWAVLFNQRKANDDTHLSSVIDPLIHQAVNQVDTQMWPHKTDEAF